MKKLGLLFLGILFVITNITAQETKEYGDDAVLMTIDGKPVTKGEFVRIYNKNNNTAEKKSVDEYLELFENFKLKVVEAENLGYDTLPKFKNELKGYIKQLEKPYFTDSAIDEKLKKEAIERSKYDVRAEHILIKVKSDAPPADTLKAYNKIKDIYNKIKAGENFEELAKKYSEDDYSAPNGGDLGYFTVFSMVYPFESAAYNTKVGEVSDIIRTQFGYHIIKVTDKRPAHGQVKVAHIMVAVPKNADEETKKKAEEKINNIYKQLQDGADFAELAEKYSDDKGSAKHGGELSWFGTGRMVPEFEEASFALENKGDYSKPVKTSFGWHIIKLIDKKEPESMEQKEEYVLNKISKDARMDQSKEAVLERLKKEYNYKAYTKRLAPFFKYFDNKSKKNWEWDNPDLEKYHDVLITLGDTTITQADFVSYMRRYTRKYKVDDPKVYVYNEFKKFSDRVVMDYERKQLPKKYPDFKYLVKEYHDGILLFDITDKMVWSKAVKDTAGLKEFYEKNKNKYMYGKRVEVRFIEFPEKYSKKALKIINKNIGISDDELLNKLKSLAKKDTAATFVVETKLLSKGDNDKIDEHGWTADIFELENKNGMVKMAEIIKEVEPMPKELEKVRGLVTADYQNYLEKEWIKELRKKYKIEVNQDVLNSIK